MSAVAVLRLPLETDLSGFLALLKRMGVPCRVSEESGQQVLWVPDTLAAQVRELYARFPQGDPDAPIEGEVVSATPVRRFGSLRESTNVPFDALRPEYNSNWSVTLTQPLLRDLFWNQPWTQVRSSRLVYESSQEGFRGSVMDTVRGIEDAYWNLIAAERAEFVAEKSLETAKALLDQTRTQFEVGVVSKVEVTEAEAGLSQREVALIRAERRTMFRVVSGTARCAAAMLTSPDAARGVRAPRSLTRNPPCRLAITFTHGAGGRWSPATPIS